MISKVFFASCVAAVAAAETNWDKRLKTLKNSAKAVDVAVVALNDKALAATIKDDNTFKAAFKNKSEVYNLTRTDKKLKVALKVANQTLEAKVAALPKVDETDAATYVITDKNIKNAITSLQADIQAKNFDASVVADVKTATDALKAMKDLTGAAPANTGDDGCCTLGCTLCYCGISTLVLGATGAGLYFAGLLDDMLAAMGFDTEKACEDGGACKDVTDKAQEAFSGEESSEENAEENTEESGSGCACFLIIFALLAVAALAYYFMAGSSDEENTTEEESDDQ